MKLTETSSDQRIVTLLVCWHCCTYPRSWQMLFTRRVALGILELRLCWCCWWICEHADVVLCPSLGSTLVLSREEERERCTDWFLDLAFEMDRFWAKIWAFCEYLHLCSGDRANNDEATRCTAETNADNDRSSTEPDPPSTSQPKHKIFLSHSGAQKYFVENLCKDLEDHHRFPFFDIRESSLPKAERFPEHIFEAAQHCNLAVVVVSEEYFTSKWPMIELVEFVRAKKSGRNPNLKILPVFMGLSVSEFSDQTRQEGWFRKWAGWAEEDRSRINVAEYKEALKVLKAFNGMQFHQDLSTLASYQKNVVRMICKLVSPDVKWYDAHVQGGSNICEVYREQIGGIQTSGRYKVRVIGYYGVGGLGKTTMCKVLCNELALEFEDKVCHVEMAPNPSSSQKLLHLQEVLKKLTRSRIEVLRDLNEGECKDILCKRVSWEQPAFLALDNLWDDTESIEHAKMFLDHAAFPEGSVMIVTARTLRTLRCLGINESQCFEVPELSKVDARNLFLYHAANGREYVDKGDIDMIDECVSRCYFRKNEKKEHHYIPLAVKVLGIHMGSLGSEPEQWLESLQKVKDFDHFRSKEENPVFGVIRLNYDRLTPEEQALFMDIVCYHPYFDELYALFKDDKYWSCLREWWGLVHRKKWKEIGVQLQRLKDNGLLEEVDLNAGKFSMHDLYREFAKLEVQGKLIIKDKSFQSRRFVYESYPSELEMTPSGGVWENLVRVSIEEVVGRWYKDKWYEDKWYEDKNGGITSLEGIQWEHCSNVVVLKVGGLRNLKGVLNLKDLRSLRSLELRQLDKLGGVEGLEDLKNLAYFEWVQSEAIQDFVGSCIFRLEEFKDPIRPHLGQLPESLEVLRVERVGATVGRDVFARCSNLHNLKLVNIRALDGIDFGKCSSLLTLKLSIIEGLQGFTGLRTECLQSLRIKYCNDLRDASGFEHSVRLRELVLDGNHALEKVPDMQKLTGLQILKIAGCGTSEVPDLQKLTGLQILKIAGCGTSEVRGLDSLRQLRELEYSGLSRKLPSLSGLQHLHRLTLFYCKGLTGLEGVGDLPLLRYLDLSLCSSLVRLPELSKCTNLEELDLGYCSSLVRLPELSKCTNLEKLVIRFTGMELFEEDIVMLSKLPNLRPVQIGIQIELDVVKRRVLKEMLGGFGVKEERDLETPPIKLRDYKYYQRF
ncbi:hypothetical protein KC19_10G038200 [Ceratodon purpureus]|uniref:TIR domain-containing protein n=1 Tax=Ceratodon purpureus TaxID=3225 RepID=A0A8T0GJ04_CERPU|nr:hypothetical protein KC19_10G038200 [Ceratodon purpureus]